MTFRPILVTVEPATEPLTLAQAKDQCEVQGTDHDALLTSYIVAARTFVEKITATKLMSQTVEMRCSQWCDLDRLPVGPITSVTSVQYLDTAGALQTLATTVYESVLIGLTPSIRLKISQTFPATRTVTDAILVTAVAGYAALPATIGHALRLLISAWFDSRSTGDVPDGVYAMLSNHSRF